MFELARTEPDDPLLGLIREFHADSRPQKVDLGVGVYRDSDGTTPIMQAVRLAEQQLVTSQTSKSYLGTAGSAPFNSLIQAMAIGTDVLEDQVVTVQTPGGSGALRLATEILAHCSPGSTIWLPETTWSNHPTLLSRAGLPVETYPYYDPQSNQMRFADMLEAISQIPAQDCVVLHACCHNPTGLDPDEEQWRSIIDTLASRNVLPLFDLAYQGFADSLDNDTYAVRYACTVVPELFVAISCSKNFGLYRDRVGALTVMTTARRDRDAVASVMSASARTLWSMPPDHGAAVVADILGDAELRQRWISELDQMRSRLELMRQNLFSALAAKGFEEKFRHLPSSRGMFCFLGITPDQVQQLKEKHAIYMADSSRINFAGLNSDNLEYVAESVLSLL